MTLRIAHVSTIYEDAYNALLDSIPAGEQWHKGPVTLPLTTDTPTPFIISGTVGDRVDLFVNDKLLSSVTLDSPAHTAYVQLQSGKNFISVRSPLEQNMILVVAVRYAMFMRSYSEDLFFNVLVHFQDSNRQLNSALSLRAVEHQISFQRLLPPTRALRLLAGKMAVRSLISEAGTTRGVDDIITAASNTTPVVVTTEADGEIFEPAVRTLITSSQDEGGFAFHLWFPSVCTGTWAAFVKLMDNLPDSIATLTSVSDERVALDFLGRPESHLFDFESGFCSSIFSLDCLPITASVDFTLESEVALCMWAYSFDIEVELVLGRTRLDSLAGIRFVRASSAFLIDTTGAETGSIGYAYLDLPVDRVVFASAVDSVTGAILDTVVLPGSSRVVLPSGRPDHTVVITGGESVLSFDVGVPLDSCEDADPLCEGWLGLPIAGRFDRGACLDSSPSVVSLLDDLECCFGSPRVTLASAHLLSIPLSSPLSSTSSLTVTL